MRNALTYDLGDRRVLHDEHAARRANLRQEAATRRSVHDCARLQLRQCKRDELIALRRGQEVVQQKYARVPSQHLAIAGELKGESQRAQPNASRAVLVQQRTSRPTSCNRKLSCSARVSGGAKATHDPALRGDLSSLLSTVPPARGGRPCSLLSTTSVAAPAGGERGVGSGAAGNAGQCRALPTHIRARCQRAAPRRRVLWIADCVRHRHVVASPRGLQGRGSCCSSHSTHALRRR